MTQDTPEIEVNAPVRIGLYLTPVELRALRATHTFLKSPHVVYGEFLEESDLAVAAGVLEAVLKGAGLETEDGHET